jgi:hypothetical protein
MFPTDKLKKVLNDYHNRITQLEDEKFDLEYLVKKKDFEVASTVHFHKQSDT